MFRPGNHGSTFGGNPLACVAAAYTTLSIIADEGLMENAVRIGELIRTRAARAAGRCHGR